MNTVESVLLEIRRLLAEKIAPAEVNDDLPIGPTGAGLDSVAMVELLLACEERLGIPLREGLVNEHLTPRALAQALLEPSAPQ